MSTPRYYKILTTEDVSQHWVFVSKLKSASHADGRLDTQESRVIYQRIETLQLAPDDKALMLEEMVQSDDMDAIVNSVKIQEHAAELHITSLLAIDVDTVAEESYHAMLAARLRSRQDLVTELQRQVEAQRLAEG